MLARKIFGPRAPPPEETPDPISVLFAILSERHLSRTVSSFLPIRAPSLVLAILAPSRHLSDIVFDQKAANAMTLPDLSTMARLVQS